MPTLKKALSQSSGLDQELLDDGKTQEMIVTNSGSMDTDKLEYQKPAYFAVGMVLALTAFTIFLPLFVTSNILGLDVDVYKLIPVPPCQDKCSIVLVESIPDNLTYPEGSPKHLSIFEGWQNLIRIANKSIDIASFYWTMRGVDIYSDPSDWQGEMIFNELLKAGTERGIKIRIVQSEPQGSSTGNDTETLVEEGAAEVRTLNMTRLIGAGILHTKMWLVDGKHFYVGSANQDWRSLTQVKELGSVVYNCSCLASDMSKIFQVYWEMSEPNATIPEKWPKTLSTRFNVDSPMELSMNDINSTAYLASSPPRFCPRGRTPDITALLNVITKAKKFVYVAVMDYVPLMLYTPHTEFWPVIDNALRKAAVEDGLEVRVMASWWNHSRPEMRNYLDSLQALSGIRGVNIEMRLFQVPAFTEAQRKIPFARVNHNKYMVTDNAAYIGTSNWAGSYFVNTGGISLIVNQTDTSAKQSSKVKDTATVQEQLLAIFERDWTSKYTESVMLKNFNHKIRHKTNERQEL